MSDDEAEAFLAQMLEAVLRLAKDIDAADEEYRTSMSARLSAVKR